MYICKVENLKIVNLMQMISPQSHQNYFQCFLIILLWKGNILKILEGLWGGDNYS